jgi:hypothetical protein
MLGMFRQHTQDVDPVLPTIRIVGACYGNTVCSLKADTVILYRGRILSLSVGGGETSSLCITDYSPCGPP